MTKVLSGRFVLRIPSELHLTLRKLASLRGVSLNELCLRALKNYLAEIGAEESSEVKGEGPWLKALKDMLGESLLGVILFGSTARGEERIGSDIDLLVATDTDLPLTRSLYELWEQKLPGNVHSPHFVHLPVRIEDSGSIWFEAAVDGIVLYERGRRISRFLSRIRRAIAAGRLERKIAYGHPYWIRRGETSSHVQ
jgi:predicted nucleotidyltransferase